MKKSIISILFVLFLFNCGHFSQVNKGEIKSIFDEKSYYNISPYLIESYKWDKQAIEENKLYLSGLVNYFYKKDFRKALDTFDKCLNIYTEDIRSYIRIVECYARLGEKGLAYDFLNRTFNKFEILYNDVQLIHYRTELLSDDDIYKYRHRKNKIKDILLFLPRQLWKAIKLLPFI
ncbi:hypothetical protein ACFL4T_11130 [candidate division KSB1 bacterium]